MSNAKNLATFLQSGGSIAGDANFDSNTLFVDSSANAVGIGNSSAQTRLFVGNGSGTEGITIYSGTTGEGQLRFADGTSGSALYQGRVEYNHNTNKLFLGAGGTTPVAIDSSGSVGIGTSSITSGFKMEVTGDARFGDAYNDDAVELGWSAGGSVGFVQAYDRGASAFRDLSLNNSITIKSGGNVGVGTSSPSSNAIVRFIEVEDSTSAGVVLDAARVFSIYSSSSSTLAFRDETASANRMTIDSSGNVTIGTSSTTNDARLIISGTDGKHPIIKVNDGGSNGYTLLADNYTATESQVNFGISYSGAGAVVSRGVKVSDTTDNVYLSSQGLYATKPTALKLDNDGSFRFLNTNTNATTAVDTAVSLTERMRIESGGNIGIGTSSVSSLGTGITTIELKGNSASQSDRSGGIRFTRYDGNDGMYIYNADGASYIESRSTYPLLITTNGTERMRVGTSELVVNEGANNFDFRVETQNSTNGFFIDASVDRIVMASGASEDSTLTINAQSSSGTITHVSNSSIPGTGTGKVQEGVYTISGNSSNSILSIPIFSQTNVWRSFLVELRFITGEYNKSGGPLGGYGLIEFHTLNGFAQFNTIERTGNISSFSTSGTTLKVNFTTAYTGGLNNHEGVIMYAKVLSGHPSYIEFDNATFN